MPIQFMHTRLLISLHGVVLFFVIIECADKIYVRLCNNGENYKPPMHASPLYVTMVAYLA